MRISLILICLIFSITLTSSTIAFADKTQEIKDVENYLNGLTTLKSRFVQTAHDGKKSIGTFMLQRPGRLRFEYDPPVEDFVIADGILIYYYDGKMQQHSSIPIGNSIADFFLRSNLELSEDIKVSDINHIDHLMEITLTQTEHPLAGSLTLVFSKKPLQLKKWRILDAQGYSTEIEIYNTEYGVKFDKDLFFYYNPVKKKYN